MAKHSAHELNCNSSQAHLLEKLTIEFTGRSPLQCYTAPQPRSSMAAQAYPLPPPSDEAELLEAIHTLFRGEDPERKAAANRWLERWQQEPVAWSLSDRVLHNQANDLECHHFCAQTLKTKVCSTM